MDGETVHAEQFSKSCELTKVIDVIIYIKYFEQQIFIIKGL